jgi:hypothetical protein
MEGVRLARRAAAGSGLWLPEQLILGASWATQSAEPANQVSSGPTRRLVRARSTQSSSCVSSKGLVKKQIAPALIACSRIRSSGNAVMKIIGVVLPRAIKCSCSLTPLIPGISTSAMRQEVSLNRGDNKNSRAEENAWAANPIALNNRAVAVRCEASSSTIVIIGICTRLTFF